jgi:hypothetical protein
METGSVGMILADLQYGNNATMLAWDHALDLDVMWEEMWRVANRRRHRALTATPGNARLIITCFPGEIQTSLTAESLHQSWFK